jgi:hypothetical protein
LLRIARGFSLKFLNRLKTIPNVASGATLSYDVNLFDEMNRRKQITWADSSKWDYGYNLRGEVESGSRKWSDSTTVAGQQYGYLFDSIGNRTSTTTNGRSATYTPNAANQYSSRTVPGAVDVFGTASSSATVTVNTAATTRKGSYFSKELAADNSTTSVLSTATIAATLPSGTTTRASTKLLPKTPVKGNWGQGELGSASKTTGQVHYQVKQRDK